MSQGISELLEVIVYESIGQISGATRVEAQATAGLASHESRPQGENTSQKIYKTGSGFLEQTHQATLIRSN